LIALSKTALTKIKTKNLQNHSKIRFLCVLPMPTWGQRLGGQPVPARGRGGHVAPPAVPTYMAVGNPGPREVSAGIGRGSWVRIPEEMGDIFSPQVFGRPWASLGRGRPSLKAHRLAVRRRRTVASQAERRGVRHPGGQSCGLGKPRSGAASELSPFSIEVFGPGVRWGEGSHG